MGRVARNEMVIAGANGNAHRLGNGVGRMRRGKCSSVFKWPAMHGERAWQGPPSGVVQCAGRAGHSGMHGSTIFDESGRYTIEWSDRDGLLGTRGRVN